jgi:RND family efflux transporter MFP subunit
MRRALTILAGSLLAVACLLAVSLSTSGKPVFGALDGTALQERLVPGALRAALGGGQGADAGAGGRGGPLRVTTAAVERAELAETLSFSGRLVATRRVELRARVTGYLDRQSAAEASFVERGAPLFALDERTFAARVEELAAALEGAERNLAFLRREVRRISEVEGEGFATESRLDELTAERDAAAARVSELEASLRRAELDLGFASVEAPFAGRIGFWRVDEGDLVTAGETVLTTLVQYDPLEVEIRPSAPQLARMRRVLDAGEGPIGLEVRLEDGTRAGAAELAGIAPAFERDTNTIAVRARMANPDRALVPGRFVRVEARLGAARALTVPAEALIVSQAERAVLRIGPEGRVEAVPVETGDTVDGRTVVAGPIAAGDRVAVDRLQAIRPGMTVAPEPAGDAPAGPEDGAGGRAAR